MLIMPLELLRPRASTWKECHQSGGTLSTFIFKDVVSGGNIRDQGGRRVSDCCRDMRPYDRCIYEFRVNCEGIFDSIHPVPSVEKQASVREPRTVPGEGYVGVPPPVVLHKGILYSAHSCWNKIAWIIPGRLDRCPLCISRFISSTIAAQLAHSDH